ncbi:MAG: NAD(P)(+) transhydrogenase (Re/Si-specific) subunit beta [candidate division Zixibacteria bacterium]|nr:NAD(P)(+) transhydrogenase (Re/Si-specific) subunit beta [candidate division Zixibacteria bacterium]
MDNTMTLILELAIIALLIVGITLFRTPRGARWGNLTAAAALLAAIVLVASTHRIVDVSWLVAALLIGGAVGIVVAVRVTMIQIPAMVAFQHGAGGVAACTVALVELTRSGAELTPLGEVSGYLGLVIGAATFSGSMLASAKLAAKIKQTPTILPKHNFALLILLAAIAGLCLTASASTGSGPIALLIVALAASVLLGWLFAIRIGGADMPVLISFLNATAGLAAAFCGIVIKNQLLIACGATVAASGSILTAVMCKAMNRSFVKVLSGNKSVPTSVTRPAAPERPAVPRVVRTFAESMTEAKRLLHEAGSVIIVPGYGMALAKAQFKVADLSQRLMQMGKKVSFAIHPVAGRMPGHMNVLLAEADVDYELLREMDDVNGEFAATDVVLVIGACDVVNPAAIMKADTPISGMPILNAHEAKHVLVFNLDERPGYSGVPNSLYDEPSTILLFGDAGKTIGEVLASLEPTPRLEGVNV